MTYSTFNNRSTLRPLCLDDDLKIVAIDISHRDISRGGGFATIGLADEQSGIRRRRSRIADHDFVARKFLLSGDFVAIRLHRRRGLDLPSLTFLDGRAQSQRRLASDSRAVAIPLVGDLRFVTIGVRDRVRESSRQLATENSRIGSRDSRDSGRAKIRGL